MIMVRVVMVTAGVVMGMVTSTLPSWVDLVLRRICEDTLLSQLQLRRRIRRR